MATANTSVAVIGLGSMGWGAAVSLVRAGLDVHGVDVQQSLIENFNAAGGKGYLSPADAAKDCHCLLTFVVNAEQTENVLFGDDGALQSLAEGSVVIGCSTMPPALVESLAQRVIADGKHYIDAPVSGGPAKALEGAMTMMTSGDDAAFELTEDVLNAISTKVFRLGHKPGMGSKVKMINQLLAGVHIASACEAVAFGIHNEINPTTLFEVITECAGNSWMFENRVPHIVAGDYSPASAVDIFVKDLGIVTEQADQTDISLPLATAALRQFQQASDSGYGKDDDASLVKLYGEEVNQALPAQTNHS